LAAYRPEELPEENGSAKLGTSRLESESLDSEGIDGGGAGGEGDTNASRGDCGEGGGRGVERGFACGFSLTTIEAFFFSGGVSCVG